MPDSNDAIWDQIGKIYQETDNENAYLASSALMFANFATGAIIGVGTVYAPVTTLVVTEIIYLAKDPVVAYFTKIEAEVYQDSQQCLGMNPDDCL